MEQLQMVSAKTCAPASRRISAALYEKAFPVVAGFVGSMGGTFEDARDIFHDSLIVYYEKQRQENFAIESSDEFYILGIAKHLWIRKFKEYRRNVAMSNIEESIVIPADFTPVPDNPRLLDFLMRAGQKCMDLLTAFYYDKIPLQEIAQAFGYSGVRSATVQKHKCLEKVKQTIRKKSIRYEDFME